jgi:hypothetical protein
MAVTGINSEDRLVQATFAEHLKTALGWDSIYAWNDETFGRAARSGGRTRARRFSPAICARRWCASIPTCRLRQSTTRCGR